jgi:hypothetical protein
MSKITIPDMKFNSHVSIDVPTLLLDLTFYKDNY